MTGLRSQDIAQMEAKLGVRHLAYLVSDRTWRFSDFIELFETNLPRDGQWLSTCHKSEVARRLFNMGTDPQWNHLFNSAGDIGSDTDRSAGVPLSVALGLWAQGVIDQQRLVVHELTQGVIRLVEGTDLHNYPDQAPKLFDSSFVIEAKAGSFLFGETLAIEGHYTNGVIELVGILEGNRNIVTHATILWDGRPIVFDDPLLLPEELYEPELRSWTMDAMRFLTILALLLEAEKVPLLAKSETLGPQRKGHGGGGSPWSKRRLLVDGKLTSKLAGARPAGGEATHDGKLEIRFPVCGFLRHQPHGPQHSLRKWIWVEGHERRRWVPPKPLKVSLARI